MPLVVNTCVEHLWMRKHTSQREIPANKHMHDDLYTTCVTQACPHPPPLFPTASTAVVVSWLAPGLKCTLHQLCHKVHAFSSTATRAVRLLHTNERGVVSLSAPWNVPQRCAGKNNPRLHLHHLSLSAQRIISLQVNHLLSTLSYQVGLPAYKHCGLLAEIKPKLHILLNQIRRKAKAQEITSPVRSCGCRLLPPLNPIAPWTVWLSAGNSSRFGMRSKFLCFASFWVLKLASFTLKWRATKDTYKEAHYTEDKWMST